MPAFWKPKRRWVIARHAGTYLALAAFIAWLVTMFAGGITFVGPRGVRASLYGGSFNVVRALPPDPTYPPGGVHVFRNRGALWLLPSLNYSYFAAPGTTSSRWELIIPLWLIALAAGVIGRVGAIRCRAPREGLCQSCDYDLRGTPEAGVCPECGAPTRPQDFTDPA